MNTALTFFASFLCQDKKEERIQVLISNLIYC